MITSLAGIRLPIWQIRCVKGKTATMAPLSDETGDERNENFGITSIPRCLTHAFYTRLKWHLWYKVVHYAGYHFSMISECVVYKFHRNEISC